MKLRLRQWNRPRPLSTATSSTAGRAGLRSRRRRLVLAAMGHNPTIGIRDFSGEMKFDPEKLEASSFRLVDQDLFAERAG